MIHRLHLNENILYTNKCLSKNISVEASRACQYSSKKCSQTTKLIAQYYNISKDNVIMFNGLDEAIFYTVIYATIKGKGAIVTTEKTYNTINLSAEALDVPIIEMPLLGDRIDINLLCENIENYIKSSGNISLCYICNPHNPTGTLLNGSLTQLLKLAKKHNFIIFVDQAYIEMIGQEKAELQEQLSHEHLILGRTFSKAYGLAGLRCGYALTNNSNYLQWMKRVNKALMYKENRISVAAIKSVLFEDNPIKQISDQVSKNRHLLEQLLDDYGFDYIVSSTNFILCRPPCSAEKFIEYAEKRFGILLFNAKEFNWSNYVRITISSVDAIAIIKKMLLQMKEEGII